MPRNLAQNLIGAIGIANEELILARLLIDSE
jgi:hypothetical protein